MGYWPALSDALLAVMRKGAQVRMLVSKWASTLKEMWTYLDALDSTARACSDAQNPCSGSLEIRVFEVPGWESTSGPKASYPPFCRVNHAKYIVTDRRFNIGTSNMEWSYFHTTAGTSFNSNSSPLRMQLQLAFDRDWASPYA